MKISPPQTTDILSRMINGTCIRTIHVNRKTFIGNRYLSLHKIPVNTRQHRCHDIETTWWAYWDMRA